MCADRSAELTTVLRIGTNTRRRTDARKYMGHLDAHRPPKTFSGKNEPKLINRRARSAHQHSMSLKRLRAAINIHSVHERSERTIGGWMPSRPVSSSRGHRRRRRGRHNHHHLLCCCASCCCVLLLVYVALVCSQRGAPRLASPVLRSCCRI